MTKQEYIREALVKLQDVWPGALGLLYFVDNALVDDAIIDAICLLLQQAIQPVYDRDVHLQQHVSHTIQHLQLLKEGVHDASDLDALLSS
jgi:hypothetical protein